MTLSSISSTSCTPKSVSCAAFSRSSTTLNMAVNRDGFPCHRKGHTHASAKASAELGDAAATAAPPPPASHVSRLFTLILSAWSTRGSSSRSSNAFKARRAIGIDGSIAWTAVTNDCGVMFEPSIRISVISRSYSCSFIRASAFSGELTRSIVGGFRRFIVSYSE